MSISALSFPFAVSSQSSGGNAQAPAAVPASAVADQVPVALVYDLSTNQTLLARNAERRFIPASITKVMTAYVAFEMIKRGELSLREAVVVDPAIAEEWSGTGSTMFLETGDIVTVEQLLRGITAVSANDGAVALADHAAGSVDEWVERMNAAARDLGMRDSHFGTPNGWPDEGRTFTTARDLSVLAAALIAEHPALYSHFFGREGFAYNGIAQSNHDPLVGEVKGSDGIKTGYTDEAGFGFLGSAARNGRRLILVAAASPTGRARNAAAIDLMEWGFAAFETERLFPKGATIGAARIQNGEAAQVALRTAHQIHASKPESAPRGAIALAIRYLGPIPAPIEAGEEIAELEISIEGHGTHRVPLIAADDVAEAGFWTRLANGFAGLFS